jgi:lambda family phage portal protein
MISPLYDSKGKPVSFSYDGANAVGRHNDWKPIANPALSEEEVLPIHKRQTLIGHLNDLFRNSPLTQSIVQCIITNVGFPKLRSATSNDDFNKTKDELFAKWFSNCEFTSLNLRDLCGLIVKSLCLEGEVFFMLTKEGQLQAIEACRIQSNPNNKPENEIDGIRFNKNGKPTAYRVCNFNQWGSVDFSKGKYVQARNMIHVANRTRVNSLRGIPLLASSVNSLKDVQELIRATVQKQKISACLTAFVSVENPLAERWSNNGMDEPARSEHLDLRSGAIYMLQPNEKISVVESKANTGDMETFIEQRVSDILATVGLTNSVLKGFDKTSYASSRATRSITSHTFKLWRMNIEERFLNRVQFWKSAKMVNLGELPKSEEQEKVDWQFVVPPSLDRNADLKADAASLQNGLANLSDVLGEKHGQDWEEKLEQRAIEISKAKELAKQYDVPINSLLPNYIESDDAVDE